LVRVTLSRRSFAVNAANDHLLAADPRRSGFPAAAFVAPVIGACANGHAEHLD